MRIKNIQLKNFLSFANTDTDIVVNENDPPTLFLINGINYDTDNSDASNGSGKSAFISESLMYNIFSRGLRGTKQKVKLNEMIRHGAKEMMNSVEYFITEDGTTKVLNIQRAKTPKSSTTSILIDGESKSKRLKTLSDSDIRQFVDLEPEVFAQIIIYYKDNTNLLSMNYGQRIDFFKKIINLDLIDEYHEKSKEFKNTNEKYLQSLKHSKKGTADIISIIDNNKDKYESYILSELDTTEKELQELHSKTFTDVTEYENSVTELTKEVKNVDKDIKTVTNKLLVERSAIDRIDKELKKIKQLSNANCPTCHQLVTNEYVSIVEEEYIKEKEILSGNIDDCTATLKEYEKEKTKIKKEINKIQSLIDKVDIEKQQHKQNISSLNKQKNKLLKELEDSQTEGVDSSDKNKYEKKLVAIDKAIKLRTDWKDSAEYWFNLFAPKSLLRASIIRKYIVILSDIFEHYVSKLYNNEIIGKILIDDDGNIDIILYKDKYETNYWQMSSGERKRIDVAMILSLYEFTSYIKPNLPKFLILDEIFDSLDIPGINAVAETLIDVQERHGIDLFIISHVAIPITKNMDNVFVKNILVTKKDKQSTVKILD